jgi:hypothetical protein
MVLKQVLTLFFAFSHKGSAIRAFVLLFCLCFICGTSFANTVICKNEKSVRTLRSDKTTDGGCRAIYTKQGVDQVVGSSMRTGGCDSILDGIRKTLESSVWKCKDVKEAVVSDLSE